MIITISNLFVILGQFYTPLAERFGVDENILKN